MANTLGANSLMENLTLALELETLGLALFKVKGKLPVEEGWQEKLLTLKGSAPDAVSKGFNIGVRTGHHGKGLEIVVVDVDIGDSDQVNEIATKLKLPMTWVVKTGRGYHFYYAMPKQIIRNSAGKLAPHVDIRGQGGYVVGPGSTHESGKLYEWVKDCGPEQRDLSAFPNNLIALLAEDMPIMSKSLPEGALNGVKKGERNVTLTRLAGKYLAEGLDSADAFAKLVDWNEHNDPPMTQAELAKTFSSILTIEGRNHPHGRAKPKPKPKDAKLEPTARDNTLTGMGNAAKLAAKIYETMRWVPETGAWYVFNGMRLTADSTMAVERAAREVVYDLRATAKQLETNEPKLSVLFHQHAKTSASRSSILEMVGLARSEPNMILSINDMDRHPMMINCQNGTLDLRTGILLPPSIKDCITHLAPVEYDPNATCPVWEKTLLEIFEDPTGKEPAVELVAYLQRVFGYCLTGNVSEDCFFLWYGTGANGKSVVLNTMAAMMGSYATAAQWSTFLKGGNDSDKLYEKARWKGSRIVTASEMSAGQALDEGLIKTATGRDKMTARPIYGKPFEFEPTFKIHLVTNHQPRVKGGDIGIWRRVHFIPFEQSFAGRADQHLEAKLRAELPGIFAWAVRGAADWQSCGLKPTKRCLIAVEDYHDISDPTSGFFEQHCNRVMEGHESRSDVRIAYERHCFEEEIAPVKNRGTFTDLLQERGWRVTRSGGQFVVRGLELKEEARHWVITERARKARERG